MTQLSNVLMQPNPTDAVEPLTLIEKLERERSRLNKQANDDIDVVSKENHAYQVGLIGGLTNAIDIVKQHEAESEVQEDYKTLTQDVFKGAPEWVRSAAFDQDGHAWGYACKASDLSVLNGGHHATVHVKNSPLHLGSGYPGDEWWEESAIDRE